ncbi:MAG: aminotransferase class I/II-fold pyridoxal phosphate-dependent enzyme [Lachnospiraceae bacterium]|nr:aminotransferase class I/II-fold pyridoxal phosphate-dependent enzyme [Lachnospiraceae bacterium]
MKYTDMTTEELKALETSLFEKYEDAKAAGLKLDMSRGKPAPNQLSISRGLLDVVNSKSDLHAEDGTDCSNYGNLTGIPECRRLLAQMVGTTPEHVYVFGASSLNIMYDQVARSFLHGVCGSIPWCRLDEVKWLCPVPGYDRHFGVTESFGVKMINIPMHEDGPDMDLVQKYVENDPAVKGIWCVPKYSNPQGFTYSEETVRRFAALKPAAEDFRIYWDNAYAVHHLYGDHKPDTLPDIISECEKAGHPDMVYEFFSTSKISFPGAGVSGIASSLANLEDIKKYMSVQIIGHDKLNQLRHARFFKDGAGIEEQMKKHAEFIRPKFDALLSVLDKELSGTGTGSWTHPNGGYFVSFDSAEKGCAKEIVRLCAEAGVKLTGAGATYPYHNDPDDTNIRLAPTFPTVAELTKAAEIFTVCVKLVSARKILEERA